jgi:cyclophilin family peptidyl-prolyl cis-trans isomerase
VAAATVQTSHGEFTIELDAEASPRAVESFLDLARRGFFDGTVFHRIVPGFVIQGGDPTGTGTGGPGYSTVDPPAASTTYSQGVVAMAKKADDAPGTAGSQFFVVTADDAGLPPEYAVIGTVTEGLDVVMRIGELGDTAQKPTERVEIGSVKVEPNA